MIILGVDPGCLVSGFAILKKDTKVTSLLDYGYLKLPASKSLIYRVGLFHDCFAEKIKIHAVTEVALEIPFLGKNPQSFLKLGYLRGIMYLLANQNNIELREFLPSEVKQAVTGNGGAKKDQVARVIMQLFPRLPAVPEKYDVTDALAVSLCGLWRRPPIKL